MATLIPWMKKRSLKAMADLYGVWRCWRIDELAVGVTMLYRVVLASRCVICPRWIP